MKAEDINLALAYAGKGFHIFPAIWKTKTKNHIGLVPWSKESSSDPEIIKAWGRKYPDHAYFCVNLRQSNYTVVDIDAKNSKDGFGTVKELEMLHGPLPPTLQSLTPNDGEHLFYKGAAKFGANKLGPGVDIPVMVPLPGSEVPGKGTYQLVNDIEPLPLPDWVINIAGTPTIKNENKSKSLIRLDLSHNIDRAIQYMKEAEPAVEGEGGNDTTYHVLCGVKDFGISKAICLELASKHYNYRCCPAWSDSELSRITDNVYNYSQSPVGVKDPSIEFDPIVPKDLIPFAQAYDFMGETKPIKWLVKNYIEQDTITLMYGDSGSYKSFIVIDLGMHIATDMPWVNNKIEAGPVFYLAGEGHGGIRRRIKAWAKHHNIDYKIPFYISPYSIQLNDKGTIKHLIASIKAYATAPKLIIVDTLATSFGGGDENSSKDMGNFLGQMQLLREELGCAIIIVHHTGHKEKERARGAYALSAGVDAHYRVEKTEEGFTCLRSPGKMKDAVPQEDTWFKTKSIKIGVDEDSEDITSLIMERVDYIEPVKPKVFKMGKNQAIVYNIVKERKSIFMSDARELFRIEKEETGNNYDRRYFNAALDTLLSRNMVEEVNGKIVVVEAEGQIEL